MLVYVVIGPDEEVSVFSERQDAFDHVLDNWGVSEESLLAGDDFATGGSSEARLLTLSTGFARLVARQVQP